MAARRERTVRHIPFNQSLVLNQFFLKELFGVDSLVKLSEDLKSDDLELLDADNISKFHHAIKARFADGNRLCAEDLLRYDEHIVRYTLKLNRHRR